MANVIVIGGGISGLTAAYRLQQAGVNVTLLERDPQAGGQARSVKHDGFVFDRGPGSFLASGVQTAQLARDLGLGERLRTAPDAAATRYLYVNGRLQALPGGPPSLLATSLLSWRDKLRLPLEWFVPPLPAGQDETVYDFAARRFGRGLADNFITPMVIGITSGDARQTSLNSLFPRMRAMEQNHGGVLKGMVATMRGKRKATGSPTGSRPMSFPDGLGELTTALAASLGERVQTGVKASRLERHGQAWRVHTDTRGTLNADAVLVATPAPQAADLLEPFIPGNAAALREISYASVRVLGLAYRLEDVPANLEAFGFIAPRNQGVELLGCLYTSTLFPDQSPGGYAWLRVISGGVFDPSFAQLPDDEALERTRDDLRASLGITAQPTHVQQARWPAAIPQYDLNHQTRLARLYAALQAFEGLHVTGQAYRGVGINACVEQASAEAQRVLEGLKQRGLEREVVPA